MTPSPNDQLLCRPFNQWPSLDREAWHANLAPADPFDDVRYTRTRNPETLKKFRKGYGRWLAFLASRNCLDPDQAPSARITRRRLRAYFRALRRAGNADYTIIGRFNELASTIAILAPEHDGSWIRRPDGASIHALLPKATKTLVVPDSGVLRDWAIGMMDDAGTAPTGVERLLAYRDGLILAMLATRGRRLRSMTLPRIGHELILEDGRYHIILKMGQTKTGKRDRFELPKKLTRYMRHDLDCVRPALLDGRHHDALWISGRHTPLSPKGFAMMVFRRTEARFGIGFGPHRFRHAISTTAALRDPANPGLAAGVLNTSAAVIEKHYNRAGQIQAAMSYAALMEDL